MKFWQKTAEAGSSPPDAEPETGCETPVRVPLGANKFLGWLRTNKALFVMILVVGVIALIPLYGVLFPPLVDLPEHILITKLLWEKLTGVTHLDLEISRLIAYRLLPTLLLLVIGVCKFCGASLVVLPRIVPMTLISIHAMVVVTAFYFALKDKSWKSCSFATCLLLPAIVCIYSACWFIGFANYTLAITLLIPTIFLTEKFLRSGKLVDASFLFLSLLLVYTAHPFAPSFWLLWCASRALAGVVTGSAAREWKRLISLGLIFAPIILYHFLATRGTELAPASQSFLTQPPTVSIWDWYQNRFRGIVDGIYLKADDATDPRFFARFAIGAILFSTTLALFSNRSKRAKDMALSGVFLIFLSSWINEKVIPTPGVHWLAFDYRFSSTTYAICLALSAMVLIRLLPASGDKWPYRVMFVVFGCFSVLASVSHLVSVRQAYTRFDIQARQYMAKVFKYEQPAGIHLPHSRWHPDGTLIRLYICLQEPDCNPEGTTFKSYGGNLYPVRVRSSTRMLSEAELAVWRTRVPTGPLVGYWKLDEADRSEACVDSSGNGNTGAPHGTNVVAGKVGRARSFNGNGDYIDVPGINISNAITVAMWIYSDNFLQNTFLIAKNPINTQWAMLIEGRGQLKWRGAGEETSLVCDAPTNGSWHHVVARQEGTAANLYVDGILRASGSVPAIGNGEGSINIGRFNSGDHWYFTGQMDEVRIYNRALSHAEIVELFTSGSKPN